MPRGFKRAIPETKQAYQDGYFRDKRRRSFLGYKPDRPHVLHYILYGEEDVGKIRKIIFERDGYKCKRCGKPITWESGHLRHIVGGSVDRCWCLHNLEVSCADCHKPDHVHTRFGEHK